MKVKQVVWTLAGSVAVFAACSAQKVDGGGPSAVVPDAMRDAVEELRDAFTDATGLDIAGEPKDAVAGPTDPEFVGGSRIKPKFTTTTFADGAKGKQFSGWHDSARGEDCQVAAAADGKQRCMPVPYGADTVAVTAGYYSNASCTVPLFLQGISACVPTAVPKYVASNTSTSSCTVAWAFRPVTGLAANPAKYFYKPAGATTCTDIGAFPTTSYRVLSVGAEIAPSEFVEVTTSSTTG